MSLAPHQEISMKFKCIDIELLHGVRSYSQYFLNDGHEFMTMPPP